MGSRFFLSSQPVVSEPANLAVVSRGVKFVFLEMQSFAGPRDEIIERARRSHSGAVTPPEEKSAAVSGRC